jgi:hypothetical protein
VDFWLSFLPIIIYLLLIVILVVGIIIGVKLINTLNRVDKVVDDANKKLESLDGIFSLFDFITDKISLLSDKLVDGISDFFAKKLFKKRQKNTIEEREDEEDE